MFPRENASQTMLLLNGSGILIQKNMKTWQACSIQAPSSQWWNISKIQWKQIFLLQIKSGLLRGSKAGNPHPHEAGNQSILQGEEEKWKKKRIEYEEVINSTDLSHNDDCCSLMNNTEQSQSQNWNAAPAKPQAGGMQVMGNSGREILEPGINWNTWAQGDVWFSYFCWISSQQLWESYRMDLMLVAWRSGGGAGTQWHSVLEQGQWVACANWLQSSDHWKDFLPAFPIRFRKWDCFKKHITYTDIVLEKGNNQPHGA